MKRIVFNLKREWYDKIASGEKTVEFRSLTDKNGKPSKWCAIFGMDPARYYHHGHPSWEQDKAYEGHISQLSPVDWFAIFRVGYPSNSKPRKWPDIVCRIKKIDIGTCPYPGWNGEYFRILFENRGGTR